MFSLVTSALSKASSIFTPRLTSRASRFTVPTSRTKADGWYSPSSLFNFVHQDTGCDQFPKVNSPFMRYICEEGDKFEAYVEEEIIKRVGCENVVRVQEKLTQNAYDQTMQALQHEVPVIFQASLFDPESGMYGIADVLVHRSVINQITSTTVPLDKFDNSYFVIDIKSSNVKLTTKGIISNAGNYQFYKLQVYMYTAILENILEENIPVGFILGNGYTIASEKKPDPFYMLAPIYFDKEDKFVQDTLAGAMLYYSAHPEPELPTIGNLNMCAATNNQNYPQKEEIAKQLGEITLLWRVTTKNRDIAKANGFTSIYDEGICANDMGVNGSIVKNVDNMLAVNREYGKELRGETVSESTLRLPKILVDEAIYDHHILRNKQDKLVLIDVETLKVYESPIKKISVMFMIGVFYYDKTTDSYVTRVWKIPHDKKPSKGTEEELVSKFYKFLRQYIVDHQEVYLAHWSPAEPSLFRDYEDDFPVEARWFDLMALLIKNHFAVRGCFKYALKSVANALYDLGHIPIKWGSGRCANGMDAMILAQEYYASTDINREHLIIHEIEEYNKIDVMVMHYIIRFLIERRAHIAH